MWHNPSCLQYIKEGIKVDPSQNILFKPGNGGGDLSPLGKIIFWETNILNIYNVHLIWD